MSEFKPRYKTSQSAFQKSTDFPHLFWRAEFINGTSLSARAKLGLQRVVDLYPSCISQYSVYILANRSCTVSEHRTGLFRIRFSIIISVFTIQSRYTADNSQLNYELATNTLTRPRFINGQTRKSQKHDQQSRTDYRANNNHSQNQYIHQ